MRIDIKGFQVAFDTVDATVKEGLLSCSSAIKVSLNNTDVSFAFDLRERAGLPYLESTELLITIGSIDLHTNMHSFACGAIKGVLQVLTLGNFDNLIEVGSGVAGQSLAAL